MLIHFLSGFNTSLCQYAARLVKWLLIVSAIFAFSMYKIGIIEALASKPYIYTILYLATAIFPQALIEKRIEENVASFTGNGHPCIDNAHMRNNLACIAYFFSPFLFLFFLWKHVHQSK